MNKLTHCLCGFVTLLAALSIPVSAQTMAGAATDGHTKPAKKRAKAASLRTLSGTITWEADATLEDGAIVNVWLQEVAPLSVVANVLARQVIKRQYEKPIAFRLKYDARKIQPDGRYYVLVKIYQGDRTRFINVARYPVINEGCTDQCEILVDPMN